MKKCEKCIHEKVCQHKANIQTDTYAYMGVKYDTENCQHYMPNTEQIEKIENKNKALWEIMKQQDFIIAHLEEELAKVKIDTAREIFEEIEKAICGITAKNVIECTFEIDRTEYTELKNKYTEGEK